MVADLFSLLAQTASPKGGSREKVNCADSFSEGEAGKRRIAQSASTERKTEKGTKASRGVGKGKGGERLVRRLEQTSSVCLRRQLPRRGKPRKERKTTEALDRAKRGKSWCGGWSRPLQSACADSFPEGGSRERANCAERFYREESRGVGKGKAERTGTIPRRAGIKIDEVYTHIRLRIRGNRFRKAIL